MTGSSKIKVALVVLNDLGSGGAHNYESGVIKDLVIAENSTYEFLIFAPHKLVSATKQRFEIIWLHDALIVISKYGLIIF